MDAALKAIADPHRREILRIVRDDERTAGDIAAQFAVSRPAISQHLKVLIDAELVSVRKDGNRRFYRARPETINGVIRFLDRFWEDRLEKLKLAAEAEERARTGGVPPGATGDS
ncbi:MAG: metalloregulator ArsR/SmtB family transcription factor [Alphaproteobacteria bacterium]